MESEDHDPGTLKFTSADENRVLRSMQASCSIFATGVAATTGLVRQFAQDRRRNLRAAIVELGDAVRLPSDQKPGVASSVVFQQVENAIQDVGAAAIRAIILAATAARRAQEETAKNLYPFSSADESENSFAPPAYYTSQDGSRGTDAETDAGSAELSPDAYRSQLQQRHFAVQLNGGPFREGGKVFVSCSLVLQVPHAGTAPAAAYLDLAEPKVAFVCSAEGLSLESAASASVEVYADRDTDAVVFMLKVRKANRYRITITAYQGGVIRGQLVINDPASYFAHLTEGREQIVPADPRPSSIGGWSQPAVEPSLSVDLNGPTINIVGSSPSDILDWNAIDLGNWRMSADKVLEFVGRYVGGLYANPPPADDIDHEFLVLGDRIAKVIPEKLARALGDPRLKLLAMQVTVAFDFPLDLCKVETPEGGEQLVQDRMAVSRWFANTHAIKLNRNHRVSDIALVIGKMKRDATVEMQAFDPTTPARFKIFNTRQELIDEVFKTNRFHLMHYFGHSGRGDELGRYLSLANDEKTLRLQEIGARVKHRAFFSRNPIIVMNCCDGAQPSALLGGLESLPHCFIDNACVACIGSIWPVDSRAGNHFMTALYAHLANGKFFHEAVRDARHDLLEKAKSVDSSNEKLNLILAARAYVYYGPPDLRCTFLETNP